MLCVFPLPSYVIKRNNIKLLCNDVKTKCGKLNSKETCKTHTNMQPDRWERVRVREKSREERILLGKIIMLRVNGASWYFAENAIVVLLTLPGCMNVRTHSVCTSTRTPPVRYFT